MIVHYNLKVQRAMVDRLLRKYGILVVNAFMDNRTLIKRDNLKMPTMMDNGYKIL